MSYNPEERAKQYVKALPEDIRNDTDTLFLIYEGFIAGHKEASTPESKDMIFDNTYEQIIQIVCDHYETTFKEINTKSRKREKVIARQVCMYFADKYTSLTITKIGAKFRKDHATMLYAVRIINELLDTDKNVMTDVRAMEMKIQRLFLT